jgi:hypothetical protein
MVLFIVLFIAGLSRVRRIDVARVEELLSRSTAPSNGVKKGALWRRGQTYAVDDRANSLPAEPSTFERFLANTTFDGSQINYSAPAVDSHHVITESPSPSTSPRVIALIAGAKRMIATCTIRTALLTNALISQLIDTSASYQSSCAVNRHRYMRLGFVLCFVALQ